MKDINALERIQRRATKFILNYKSGRKTYQVKASSAYVLL